MARKIAELSNFQQRPVETVQGAGIDLDPTGPGSPRYMFGSDICPATVQRLCGPAR